MVAHVMRVSVMVLVIAVIIVYPFLAGDYDRLAMPLSTMAQAFGVIGMLLVPIGIAWLIYQWRTHRRGYGFALASLIVATLVIAIISVIGVATAGIALGVITLALWVALIVRLIPQIRAMKGAVGEGIGAAPLYLIVLPLASLITQLVAANPMTAASRNHAIEASAQMIAEIEAYHDKYGHYPNSLSGVWKDYYPNVVCVEKYEYRAEGDAYNLYFEQPRFLLDNIGTREFVVYNPQDAHFMVSHPSFMLLLTPDEFDSAQGWYEVNDAGVDHWRYFWFD